MVASDAPSLNLEERLWAEGYLRVAGLDEAGRGAWAGPVVAAAVILPPKAPGLSNALSGVRDSKQLSASRREGLLAVIQRYALAWSLGSVPASGIDGGGIVPATRGAMAQAIAGLPSPADYLVIDHLTLPDIALPQTSLPKGDARVLSIAAASILAKVVRDRKMAELDSLFPGYGFAQHKGYGTPQHRAALETLGPCPLHRFSFRPLRELQQPEDVADPA